jgi:hypothetical protein
MKKTVLILLFIISVFNLQSQITGYSPKKYISVVNQSGILEKVENYVNAEIESWQQKGRYEKLVDYKLRVNDKARNQKIEELTQYKVNELANKVIVLEVKSAEYDAESEVFKLVFIGLPSIYIKVPILNGEAESFDKSLPNLKFHNFIYTITTQDEFALLSGEIVNSSNQKIYKYDSQKPFIFKHNDIISGFGAVKVNIRNEFAQIGAEEETENIFIGISDVDVNIPETKNANYNRYALIIGNEDYTKYQNSLKSESNVEFARRDAFVFAEYCEKTLGIPKENIVLLQDAISSQMKREIEKLSKLALYSNGEAELYFYFAGHGFPDEKTHKSYIMPVDISGVDVVSGIELSYLYKKLTENPIKRGTVFLDACFSGGGRNQGLLTARGVKIVPKENIITGNLVVFSASSGQQNSLSYKDKQHGMFTYFLLKKLQESKGNISYGELSDYIKDQVQLNSVKINSKDQNPQTLISPVVENEWRNWDFK